MIRLITLALLFTLLGGCASPSSIVLGSTGVELANKLGSPTDKRANPQGGEFWDYSYGPEGTETWRFTVDDGGVVRGAEQLLTHERLYKVAPGTTEAGVMELLGKPRMVTRYRHETVWDWRVRLIANTGYFMVRFGSDGRALGVSVLEDMTTDGHDRGDR